MKPITVSSAKTTSFYTSNGHNNTLTSPSRQKAHLSPGGKVTNFEEASHQQPLPPSLRLHSPIALCHSLSSSASPVKQRKIHSQRGKATICRSGRRITIPGSNLPLWETIAIASKSWGNKGASNSESESRKLFVSRQSITNNYFLIKSSLMIHKSHAYDQLLSHQSSDIFNLISLSFKPCSFRYVLIQSCACVCVSVAASSQLLWICETKRRRYDANICRGPFINVSSHHSMPLKCTCPLPQSVQHVAAYGNFTTTVHLQPTANISQFRSENMPSVKKKKTNQKLITAARLRTFWNLWSAQTHKKHIWENLNELSEQWQRSMWFITVANQPDRCWAWLCVYDITRS